MIHGGKHLLKVVTIYTKSERERERESVTHTHTAQQIDFEIQLVKKYRGN